MPTAPKVTLNDLDFRPEHVLTGVDFWFQISANGTTWSNAAAEISTIESRLRNGAAVAIDRYDNSVVSLFVRVFGENSEALSRGCAALTKALRRPGLGTFVFEHPDGMSPATVWDVITAEQALQFAGSNSDDVQLAMRFTAVYQVTLTCHPFPRSAVKTVVPALSGITDDPVTVLVDDCSSTTGWSTTAMGPVTESGGTVSTTGGGSAPVVVALTRTGAVDMTGTPYVLVTYAFAGTGTPYERFFIDGIEVPILSRSNVGSNRVSILEHPANFTTLKLEVDDGGAATTVTITVDKVERTNVAPSGKQVARTAPIYGTMPTEASMLIKSQAAAQLGDCLVYTAPPQATGFVPDLWPYRSDTVTQTADTSTASGHYSEIPLDGNITGGIDGNGIDFSIPAEKLAPGTYQIYVQVRLDSGSTLPTLSWSTNQTVSGNDLGWSPYQDVPVSGFVDDLFAWTIIPLDAVTLPTVRVVSGSSVGDITLRLRASEANVLIGGAWACNIDTGQVSLIDGSGGLYQLRIDAATLDDITGETTLSESYWGGRYGDTEPVFFAGQWVDSWDQHIFDPAQGNGQILIYAVTSGSADTVIDVEYYSRFADYVSAVPQVTAT